MKLAPALIIFVLACAASAEGYAPYWSYTAGSRPITAPVTYNGSIYFPAGSLLTVLDAGGNAVWTYEASQPIISLAVFDGFSYIGLNDSVVVLDGGGYPVQRMTFGYPVDYVAPANMSGFAGRFFAGGRTVTFKDMSGSLVWSYDAPLPLTSAPLQSTLDVPRLVFCSGGTLYAVADPRNVDVYSAEGAIMPQLVLQDGSIVFATTSGFVYSVSENSGFHADWSVRVADRIVSGPFLTGPPENPSYILSTSDSVIKLNSTGGIVTRYTTSSRGSTIVPFQDGSERAIVYQGNRIGVLQNLGSVWSDGSLKYMIIYAMPMKTGSYTMVLAESSDSTLTAFMDPADSKRLLAEEYMDSARHYYVAGDRFGVAAYAGLARKTYASINDTDGQRLADTLGKLMDADELYAIGRVYLEFGYYEEAANYSNQALKAYEAIGNADRAQKASELFNASYDRQRADSLLNKSLELYATKNLSLSQDYALEALELYTSLNFTEGAYMSKKAADSAVTQGRADYYLGLSVKYYFNNTSPAKAKEYLAQSKTLYTSLNNTKGVAAAERFEKRILADELLAKAQSYSAAGLNDTASEYANMSKSLYEETGYELGIAKTRAFLKAADSQGLNLVMIAFLLFIVLVSALVYLRLRR